VNAKANQRGNASRSKNAQSSTGRTPTHKSKTWPSAF
jgi:hypothetical protein